MTITFRGLFSVKSMSLKWRWPGEMALTPWSLLFEWSDNVGQQFERYYKNKSHFMERLNDSIFGKRLKVIICCVISFKSKLSDLRGYCTFSATIFHLIWLNVSSLIGRIIECNIYVSGITWPCEENCYITEGMLSIIRLIWKTQQGLINSYIIYISRLSFWLVCWVLLLIYRCFVWKK